MNVTFLRIVNRFHFDRMKLQAKGAAGVVCISLLGAFCVAAQAQQKEGAKPAGTRSAYYYDPHELDLKLLVPQPPAVDSAANKAELAELHSIEQRRTAEQAARAKADEDNESMFAFSTVLGAGFTAKALPITAELGEHVKNEQSMAGGTLKGYFQRPRPYQTDPTLHPVCAVKTVHDSYPSGHGLTGYLEAFTLVQLVPEKRAEILARAEDYAHNRLVCGVHYPSDEEASLRVANAVFGNMLANPKFQHDLEAAREELKAKGIVAKKD